VVPAPLSLRESRIRASFLLKDLRSGDPFRTAQAGQRLSAVPRFAALGPEQIAARAGEVQLKHALEVVAREQGFASWSELKTASEANPATGLDTARLLRRPGGGFLNHWYARYEEAQASLAAVGGFLFPYRGQYFICDAGLLEQHGIDPGDPDWARIGRDWVRPADPQARDRLERVLDARLPQ
jgi:hypothetical protein